MFSIIKPLIVFSRSSNLFSQNRSSASYNKMHLLPFKYSTLISCTSKKSRNQEKQQYSIKKKEHAYWIPCKSVVRKMKYDEHLLMCTCATIELAMSSFGYHSETCSEKCCEARKELEISPIKYLSLSVQNQIARPIRKCQYKIGSLLCKNYSYFY